MNRALGSTARVHALTGCPATCPARYAFPTWLADVKMALQYGLHVLKHRIEIVAIDRWIVVTIFPGKTMRKIAPAAGVHELALSALLAKMN